MSVCVEGQREGVRGVQGAVLGGSTGMAHVVGGWDPEQGLLTALPGTVTLLWPVPSEHTFAPHFLPPSVTRFP